MASLLGAPPRHRCHDKRCQVRCDRNLRKDLVRHAGMVPRSWRYHDSFAGSLVELAIEHGVRVPRSLRHLIPETPVFVCPGCQSIAAEPCAPWCPDDSIRRDREERDLFADFTSDAYADDDGEDF